VPSAAYISKGAKPIELATVIVLDEVTEVGSSARAAASSFVAVLVPLVLLVPLVADVFVAELLPPEQALRTPASSAADARAPTTDVLVRLMGFIWFSWD
jgi:hypothetical protein